MKTTKAVITAAARNQRTLPLQTLIDRDGVQKSVLRIIIEDAVQAGIENICVVICPGDETAYREAAGDHSERIHFVPQVEPLGYGHAIFCAREFVRDEPFLHMVGDHIFISGIDKGCAQQLVEVAEAHDCAVSGVQATRENLLPFFGTVGGQRVKGSDDLYVIERVMEKPTPTDAEQSLMVPGLRTGHYLCFFGIHLLTSNVMHILEERLTAGGENSIQYLSPVLDELAGREQYLALDTRGRRYPVDVRYGLLTAQLGLALSGRDRDEVLSGMVELLAQREMTSPPGSR